MDKSNKEKKIVFSDTHIRHAQLKVRLDYDGLSQAEFFRSIVTGYLNKDKDLIGYIQSYKSDKGIQSKRNIKYAVEDDSKSDELLAKFGIKSEELEDIFDMIAEEHPDL
tara:strand:- start:48 stop:374 length:327 start_codon:yes stop_codon:yes gene_type:complete